MQGCILLHGKDVVHLLRLERLRARNKDNAGDRFAFVHGSVSQNGGGDHDEAAEYESRVSGVPSADHHL